MMLKATVSGMILGMICCSGTAWSELPDNGWFPHDKTAAKPSDKYIWIPDSDTALRIGATMMEAHVGKSNFNRLMKGYELHVMKAGDTWHVFPFPKSFAKPHLNLKAHPPSMEIEVLAGGGGTPDIILSAQDGRVLGYYANR